MSEEKNLPKLFKSFYIFLILHPATCNSYIQKVIKSFQLHNKKISSTERWACSLKYDKPGIRVPVKNCNGEVTPPVSVSHYSIPLDGFVKG